LTGNRIARVFFCFTDGRLVALHGFVKKTQETPADELKLARRRKANSNERRAIMTTKKPRSTKGFTTLDNFLEEEGVRDAFQAVAIKEVLAWQIKHAMESQKLSQARLAKLMGTSRSQVSRLLDPTDGNVTLATLQRAAEMLGRKVRLELV
jgi:predicted XRE-type DNA-binding protein